MLLLITVLLIFLSNGSDVAAEPVADCIARELVDFNANFDAALYKEKIFADTLVTREDLVQALREYGRKSFKESPAYQAVREATEHRSELDQLGQLFDSCKEEVSGGESAEGTGAALGTIFATAMEGESLNFNSTAVETSSPKQGCNVITGLHLEAGALLDVSYTFYFDGGANFPNRLCFGAELGVGVEVSLAILLSGHVCCSVAVEVDAAFGLAVGFTVYSPWPDDPRCPPFEAYEITLGGGIGFGLGMAMCS